MLFIEKVEAGVLCVEVDTMDHEEIFDVVFFVAFPNQVREGIEIVQNLSKSLPFLSL